MLSTRPIARALRTAARPLSARAFTSTRRLAAEQVRIVEVGPRDGLQNEKMAIPVATKIELINRLATTGLTTIEAGSFVSPKWTPQMANSDQIFAHMLQAPPHSPHPITYQWLLPNTKGLDNFLRLHDGAASPPPLQSEVSIFLAATDTFSLKNTNRTIADSLAAVEPIFARCKAANLPVRAYISVALGCPYEGPSVDPHKVASLAASLLELGAAEISVADTTGMGTAPTTAALLRALAAAGVQPVDIALHLHDTYGQALVNAVVALEHGVRVFDSAVSGLGGCPYSPGATGNVATEDLVHCLHGLGAETGVDIQAVAEVGAWIRGELGSANESRAGKAVLANMKR